MIRRSKKNNPNQPLLFTLDDYTPLGGEVPPKEPVVTSNSTVTSTKIDPNLVADKIFLLRHGSYSKNGYEDKDRYLNERGKREIRAFGNFQREIYGEGLMLVVASTSLRATQSGEVLRDEFGAKLVLSDDISEYGSQRGGFERILRNMREGVEKLVVLSHWNVLKSFRGFTAEVLSVPWDDEKMYNVFDGLDTGCAVCYDTQTGQAYEFPSKEQVLSIANPVVKTLQERGYVLEDSPLVLGDYQTISAEEIPLGPVLRVHKAFGRGGKDFKVNEFCWVGKSHGGGRSFSVGGNEYFFRFDQTKGETTNFSFRKGSANMRYSGITEPMCKISQDFFEFLRTQAVEEKDQEY